MRHFRTPLTYFQGVRTPPPNPLIYAPVLGGKVTTILAMPGVKRLHFLLFYSHAQLRLKLHVPCRVTCRPTLFYVIYFTIAISIRPRNYRKKVCFRNCATVIFTISAFCRPILTFCHTPHILGKSFHLTF